MGNSYKNSSGYADPTAFRAVANIEREEKTLHIEYPSGYMDLYMNEFFPCTVEKARKVFRLMRAYSPDSDKEKLLLYLNRQVQSFTDQMKHYAEMAASTEIKSERGRYTAEFKQAQMKKRRAQRNIEMLREVM